MTTLVTVTGFAGPLHRGDSIQGDPSSQNQGGEEPPGLGTRSVQSMVPTVRNRGNGFKLKW